MENLGGARTLFFSCFLCFICLTLNVFFQLGSLGSEGRFNFDLFFPQQLQLILCYCLSFLLLFYLLTVHKLDHLSSLLPQLCCWVKCRRVACLDYHCLLAQWMEVSTYVTTSGLAEQTRNSKTKVYQSVLQASWQSLFGQNL